MGDGGAAADGAMVRRLLDSLVNRCARGSVSDGSIRFSMPASLHPSSFSPSSAAATVHASHLSKLALQAIHGRCDAVVRQSIYSWHYFCESLRGTSTWTSSILMLSLVMYCYLRLGSTRQIQSLFDLKEGLNAGTSLNGAEFELDSDEYEFEDDSEAEDGQANGHSRPLRRVFHLRHGHRRPGSKDSSATIKRNSSIVRITSSDPRSSLSSAPIQFDLDPKSTQTALMETGLDAQAACLIQNSGSAARRRRESGRLLNGVNNGSVGNAAWPSKGNSSATTGSRTSSPRLSASHGHASTLRPGRTQQRRPVGKSLSQGVAPSSPKGDEGEWNQSTSSSPHSFLSAGSDFDEGQSSLLPPSSGPPSILRREPKNYASIPRVEESAPETSDQAGWQGHGTESSVGSLENDAYSFAMLPPPHLSQPLRSRLPPGAKAPALHRTASLPRLGSLTAAQARAAWPEKRTRSIRLQEPDWRPYAEVHDRARERLEAAASVAAKPGSSYPMLTSRGQEQGMSTEEPFSNLMPWHEDRKVQKSIQAFSSQQLQDEEEFWFERFTQSTAAAGRDWDWRKKRRARREAAAAAEAERAATTSTSLAEQQDEPVSRVNGNGNASSSMANVGRTDVQLQKQRSDLGFQPGLFALSNDVGSASPSRPTLTVTASDSFLFRSTPEKSSNGMMSSSQGPSSKGKVLRLKRFSSPDRPANGANSRVGPNGEGVSSLSADPSAKRGRHSMPMSGSRSVTEGEQRDDDESVNVPGRLSSLTPKVVKRRALSAKRERDAALTAQLLAEAEAMNTDEEEGESKGETERQGYQWSGAGIRKSTSGSGLNGQLDQDAPRSSADVWSSPAPLPQPASELAWSSADAYGPASPLAKTAPAEFFIDRTSSPPLSPSLSSQSTLPALDLAHPRTERSRQDSMTESHSGSNSSSSKQDDLVPPSFQPRRRTTSRKDILSSATRATVKGK